MYHTDAREYHCGLGRWTAQDPIPYPDGMNLYQYCCSSPVVGTDPSGFVDLWKVAGGALGALAGIAELDIGLTTAKSGVAGAVLSLKGGADTLLGAGKMLEGLVGIEGMGLPGNVAEVFADAASYAVTGKRSEAARLVADVLDIIATKKLIGAAKAAYFMKHPFAAGDAGHSTAWTPLGPVDIYDEAAAVKELRIGKGPIHAAINTSNNIYLGLAGGRLASESLRVGSTNAEDRGQK